VKKVLIVISEMSSLLAEAMRYVLAGNNMEAVVCSHEQAMRKLIESEPEVVIVLDYHEGVNESQLIGEQTFKDLQASVTDEKIIRCGLDKYGHSDYLKLPCNIEELKKLLGI
jgi:hypothetical protein